ncbi:MAG: endoglucanase, partial [Chloroflexi bacterium]|nr:endoglucanase [Chloroflexota bacterium]
GALAIADVLGIYGREDVYFASYWRYPEIDQPGYYAFKMYTNYDDNGGRFGDTSVQAVSIDPDKVSAFASVDGKSGNLMVMLINKDPGGEAQIKLNVDNFSFAAGRTATLYRYSQAQVTGITREAITLDDAGMLKLPAYSISLIVVDRQQAAG